MMAYIIFGVENTHMVWNFIVDYSQSVQIINFKLKVAINFGGRHEKLLNIFKITNEP